MEQRVSCVNFDQCPKSHSSVIHSLIYISEYLCIITPTELFSMRHKGVDARLKLEHLT